MRYQDFLAKKRRLTPNVGLLKPDDLPPQLYDWQAAIVRWALRKGRACLFADCGLGKTFMQVAWAHALKVPTLIIAPLCVSEQTIEEADKLGIDIRYSADGRPNGQITITNYERVDRFSAHDYQAVVLDESSILKAFDGKTRSKLIRTFADTKYRLCCTATPSPNDIAELANHAQFLGLMTHAEFLATWFVHDDNGWRMKRHAVDPFYRWLASWAVALRTPSDLGYADDGFILPPLTIHDEVCEIDQPIAGALFPELAAKGIGGRLAARRASVDLRVERTRELITNSHHGQWLVWCGLNAEATALTQAIPGAVNVQGSDSHETKSQAIRDFLAGKIDVLVSKAKILGFGMNFQHCSRMAFLGLSDSYEAYYQCIRRCWRFGQTQPVDVYVVVSDAERLVVENIRRKQADAIRLADGLLQHIQEFEREELTV